MTVGAAGTDFVHTAICYGSDDELVDAVVPFIGDGLECKEPVFVNLAAPRVRALRAALGEDAERVQWSDARRWQPHPARRLRAIEELVDGEVRQGSGPLRFVGECPWPDGPPELVAEWERFDAVLNLVLAGVPLTMVCAYDAGALPREVVDHIAATHPFLGVTPRVTSPHYVGAAASLSAVASGRLEVPPDAARCPGKVTPSAARAQLQGALAGAPLDEDALADLTVVISEVVTNSWHVGASSVEVAWWRAGDRVVVQVDDDGPGLDDPLAGYRRPSTGVEAGRGLWISRQLADIVQMESGHGGTSVRVTVFTPPR